MAQNTMIPSWMIIYHILPISITGFAYGWEVGSMGGILAMPQFLDYFDTPSSFKQGLMTVALIAGEFGGILLFGLLIADRFGRRMTIMISVVVYLIGQSILVASQTQGMFIAGRIINGLGAGPLFQSMSVYTAEIIPPHIRGRITATMTTGIAFGIFVAYWVQYGALNIRSNAAWRLCFALQLVPGGVVGAIMFFRPESPRWLVQHGHEEKALKIMADLNADGDTENAVVCSQFEEIRVVVNLEKSKAPPSYFTLLFGKEYRRRCALAMGQQCIQQISGANIVLYYAAKVFAQTGRTGTSAALLANGISSALLVVGCLSLAILIDYYGRRKPIIVAPACMGMCLTVVGSMLVSYGSPHFDNTTQAVQFTFKNVAAGNAAVTFMFLFQFSFGAFSSSIPWTYQSEVFPIIARARGTSLSTAANYFTNFWLGLYIPEALNGASWKLYFIFGAINFTSSIVGFLFYPETSGKTLEELELLFTSDRTAFVFRDKNACSKCSTLQDGIGDDPEVIAIELREKLTQKRHGTNAATSSADDEKVDDSTVAHLE